MHERLTFYQTVTRGEQPDEGVEVDEKNDQIALRRIVAGREILRNHERNSVRQRQLGCSPCSAGRLKNTQCLLPVNGRGCVFQVPASRHFLYVAYNPATPHDSPNW